MADIDKSLPNEPRKEINIPGEEEIQEQVVEAIEEEQQSPDYEGKMKDVEEGVPDDILEDAGMKDFKK